MTTFIGLGTTSVYGATQGAVAPLAKTQAVKWAKDNIQVNCLALGFIHTPLTAESLWPNPKKARMISGPDSCPPTRQRARNGVHLAAACGTGIELSHRAVHRAVDGGVLASRSMNRLTYAASKKCLEQSSMTPRHANRGWSAILTQGISHGTP